jgi:hypothetical protein
LQQHIWLLLLLLLLLLSKQVALTPWTVQRPSPLLWGSLTAWSQQTQIW